MSDEYTPSDQDMRDHIVWMAPEGKETAHLAAFNRWLAERDAALIEKFTDHIASLAMLSDDQDRTVRRIGERSGAELREGTS